MRNLDYNNLTNKPTALEVSLNILNTYFFDFSDNNNKHVTTSTEIQDLSNIFFNTITPSNPNSKIIINLKLTYFSCVAHAERINIEVWRDNTLLSNDETNPILLETLER